MQAPKVQEVHVRADKVLVKHGAVIVDMHSAAAYFHTIRSMFQKFLQPQNM